LRIVGDKSPSNTYLNMTDKKLATILSIFISVSLIALLIVIKGYNVKVTKTEFDWSALLLGCLLLKLGLLWRKLDMNANNRTGLIILGIGSMLMGLLDLIFG
jgi:hypothetical protein